MDKQIFISFLSIFGLALVVRLLACIQKQSSFDSFGHLLFAKLLREQKKGPFHPIMLNVLEPSPLYKPFLWNWFVGFMRLSFILKYAKYINGVLDAIFVFIICVLLHFSGFKTQVVYLTALIYIFSPMLFSDVSTGPRISGFTPRLSSEIALNLLWMLLLLPLPLSNFWIFTLTTLLVFYVLNSSKFGIQALFFLTPLITLLELTPTPLYSLAGGLILSITLGKKFFINQLESQRKHLIWYYKENANNNSHISNRNSLTHLFPDKNIIGLRAILHFLHNALSINSYLAVTLKLPIANLALLVISYNIIYSQAINDLNIMAPAIAAFIIFFAVNNKNFLFLGEAERYLNHVVVFVILIPVTFFLESNYEWAIFLVIFSGFVYWLMETFFWYRFKNYLLDNEGKDRGKIIDDLQSTDAELKILLYPYVAMGGVFYVLLKTKHTLLYQFGVQKELTDKLHQHYSSGYPFVRLEKLDELAKEYDINYVVIDKEHLKKNYPIGLALSNQWVKKDLELTAYDVYVRNDYGLI